MEICIRYLLSFLIVCAPAWGAEKKCIDALIQDGTLFSTDRTFFSNLGEVDPDSFNYAGNRYGHDESFESMLATHTDLNDLLNQYLGDVGGPLLEIGPLYSPMIDPAHGSQPVIYWECDLGALRALSNQAKSNRRPRPEVHPLFMNFNTCTKSDWHHFAERNQQILGPSGSFGAVVISQVLNYVNFKSLLRDAAQFQQPGDLLFINNTLHYGDTDYLHPLRPFSAVEIERKLKTLGYVILDRRESDYVAGLPTLTLVAKKAL